jgi:hypothetical protein
MAVQGDALFIIPVLCMPASCHVTARAAAVAQFITVLLPDRSASTQGPGRHSLA